MAKAHRCEVCGKRFPSPTTLSEHSNVHTGKRPIKCDLCPAAFRSRSNLNKHKRIHSGKVVKAFCCSVCQLRYPSRCFLTIHLRSHAGEPRRYKCPACGAGFYRLETYGQHVCTARKTSVTSYSCDHCKVKFKTPNGLFMHRKRFHSAKSARYQCARCFKQIMRRKQLAPHVRRCNGFGERALQPCEVCEKLVLLSKMKTHMLCHTKPFGCSHCPTRYHSRSVLRYHLNVHVQNRRLRCQFCSASFDAPTRLTAHERIHRVASPDLYPNRYSRGGRLLAIRQDNQLKTWTCTFCPSTAFRRHSQLARHLTVAHAAVKAVFHCAACAKSFQQKARLIQHFLSVHSKKQMVLCKLCGTSLVGNHGLRSHMRYHMLPYKCAQCGAREKNRHSLTQHLLIAHFDMEKPSYGCSRCKLCYVAKSGLIIHLSLHTGEKRFACESCPHRFRFKSVRDEHMLTVHVGQKSQRRRYKTHAAAKTKAVRSTVASSNYASTA